MTEPWFDPIRWGWLPGTLLGCSVGLWGSLAGILVPRGKAPRLVIGLGLMLAGLAVLFLTAGLIGLALGQPFGVWYGLILAGGIVSCQGVVFLPLILKGYRQAEERRMRAEDFN